FHALRNGFVDIYQTTAETGEDALNLFLEGKLQPLEHYTRKKD
ncbi:unnamed protein product, partial [marine sediment metagenome]